MPRTVKLPKIGSSIRAAIRREVAESLVLKAGEEKAIDATDGSAQKRSAEKPSSTLQEL